MILRVLLAVLAIWGMTWSKDASAIYMVRTCQTVLVGWDGYEAIYEEQCRYENWEWGGGDYDPDPGYGGGSGGGTAPMTVDAPPAAAAITCSETLPIRQENACMVAGKHGFKPSLLNTGRTIRIRWSTGTEETYVTNGLISPGLWMSPVPGTCRDQ